LSHLWYLRDMDIRAKLDNRGISVRPERKNAWDRWGKDFVIWIYESYQRVSEYEHLKKKAPKRRIREDSEQNNLLSIEDLANAYKLVLKTSHIWLPKIRDHFEARDDSLIETILSRMNEVFTGLISGIEGSGYVVYKDGEIEINQIPLTDEIREASGKEYRSKFSYANLVGVLYVHLKYFIKHDEYMGLLSRILGDNKDALRQRITRSLMKADVYSEYSRRILAYMIIAHPELETERGLHEDYTDISKWIEDQMNKIAIKGKR